MRLNIQCGFQSESIKKAETKARYYITGGIIAFSGFAWLILYFAGLVEAGDKIFFFLVELTLLAYGIGIIVWPKGEQGDLETSSSKKSSDAVEDILKRMEKIRNISTILYRTFQS
ncbi:MAG: hypothetical protein V8T45_07355 [Oscillospiraceae bacterium]